MHHLAAEVRALFRKFTVQVFLMGSINIRLDASNPIAILQNC